ncbi:glutathione hydrolase 7 [Anabrus simplex]|uniref:glutathione hydrolase 7 n=1 Tax=Anabrus simplex TaxID=316456 RepID=UPI0035A33018
MNSSDAAAMTAINETGVPSIPGPYLSPEQTESFPLKQALYGGVHKANGGCCSCLQNEDGRGSLRVIITCFFTLTLAITTALAAQIYFGDYQLVPHGSVATDSHTCSVIGTDILKRGGNAVDAAVASTFCMGVVNPHVTGLGGGGFLLVYDHRKKMVLDVIDFREEAPAGYHEATLASLQNPDDVGDGNFVGVPGFSRGLGLAHKLYGKLEWKDVIMPSVHLARTGFPVPESLIPALSRLTPGRKTNSKLQAMFRPYLPGENFMFAHLPAALERIATVGPDEIYNGSLARTIVSAVNQAGGNMTLHDLASFQPVRRKVLHATFENFEVYVPGPPSGGPFLLSVLELLQGSNFSTNEFQTISSLTQKMEYVYQTHKGSWGDPAFSEVESEQNFNATPWEFPEAASSHVAAVDLNDLYVSVVSGLNTWFGSQVMTDADFILNNALKNFDVGNNSAAAGKRPLSLATPVIVTESKQVCGRRLVLGAGDASVAIQLLTELILLDRNATVSVEAPRFHINPLGKQLGFEGEIATFSNATLTQLEQLGYKLQKLPKPYLSCNLVEKIQDSLNSHSDSRGGGISSRFE